ncbi:uncharacterized protein LOC122073129 [Macadamia integrifolia]|uniref:uncharacterized protein LOC122073129 n=1 Tax=Macadamia integrifolia TaxID=60698 RepID=UPI001C4FCD5F|nr:uncharacterized protein LOC122073129 [Macadamia integrifolia]
MSRMSRTSYSITNKSALMEIRTSPPPILEEDDKKYQILHFSHPQHTLLQITLPSLFTCMGCKEFGAGNRFKCLQCDFELHEFCAMAPPSLKSHSLHSQHSLIFFTKPVKGGNLRSSCDVCSKSIKGYAFRCSTCNFSMHPCCAQLSWEMNFPVHAHNLKLLSSTMSATGDSDFFCYECKRKRSGRVYRCGVCDHYHLHAVCAKNMVNGLYVNGIKAPENPSKFGKVVGVASHVILGLVGGLLESIGEGVGEALFDTMR